MASVATLVDNFDGSALNANWLAPSASGAGCSVVVSGGNVTFTVANYGTSEIFSSALYSMMNDTIVFRISNINFPKLCMYSVNMTGGSDAIALMIGNVPFTTLDSSVPMHIGLQKYISSPGSLTSDEGTAFNATTTPWVRIRTGSTFYVDVSPDSATWTQVASMAGITLSTQRFDTYCTDLQVNATSASVSVDSLNVLQAVVQNAIHAHTVPNVALGVKLVVNNTLHAHTVQNIPLGVKLVSSNTLHAHTVGSVVLSSTVPLIVSNSTHAHAVTSPTLIQKQLLVVANARNTHTVTTPTLTQKHVLTSNNTLHAHTVTVAGLIQKFILTVHSTFHQHRVSSTFALIQLPEGEQSEGDYGLGSQNTGNFSAGSTGSGDYGLGSQDGGQLEVATNPTGTWDVI